jgi:hypothetical protein
VSKLGYTLSSEEFDAPSLVAQAERAEPVDNPLGPGSSCCPTAARVSL